MKTIREKVCGRIQELRKMAGMTQEELRERASLSVDGIRKIEGVRTTPTLETLEKLARAFQMPLPDLVRFDETSTEHQRELEEIRLYLAAKDPEDVRFVRRVMEAVMEGLEKRKAR